jgi:hypothetical protein
MLWALFPDQSKIPNVISNCIEMFLGITPPKLTKGELINCQLWEL